MLDPDFLSILKPLYVLSVPFCVRKYKLKGNVILATSMRDIIAAVVGNLAMYILLYFTLMSFTELLDTIVIYDIYFLTYVLYAVNHTIHSILNITKSKCHVNIVSNLQQIHKILKSQEDSKFLRLFVNITLISLFSIYFLLVFFKLTVDPLWFWARSIFVFLTIIFDLELFYTSFIVLFLALKIQKWSNLIKYKKRIISIKDMIRDTESEEDVMLDTFRKIFYTIGDIEKSSKVTILNHLIMQFVQSMAYVQIWIEWLKHNTLGNIVLSSHTMGIIVWTTKCMIIEVILSVCCEILYREVLNTRTVILQYLVDSYTNKDRHFAKKVLKITYIQFRKLNGCGVFTVEAALPLNLAVVMANYTVVLLQFAFI